MSTRLLSSLLLLAFVLGRGHSVFAFETDQYNLPPEPLADIGQEFALYVRDGIQLAVDDINAQIALHTTCLAEVAEQRGNCGSPAQERQKLEDLRRPDAVAAAVYARLGKGNIFTSTTGKWLNSHKFAHEPARYKTSYADSIFVPMPIDYATISPTVRMYGTEFGTDKMDHFFQQGYRYYQIYEKAIGKGSERAHAQRQAVRWGQRTERLFFGMLISGVYSNADLFANYAGMKFYVRLTDAVLLSNGLKLAPVLELRNGRWSFNQNQDPGQGVVKTFISDHLNEALNPSGYSLLLFPTVKRVVKNRACSEWRRAFPDLTREKAAERTAALETWNGEDYGFTRKSKSVTIADACF